MANEKFFRETAVENPLPEDVYEKFHIKQSFLDDYVHKKIHMAETHVKEIEKHLMNVCDGSCQKRIQEIIDRDHRTDPKMAQLPEDDR